ncbi:MAG: hypothetical protein D4R70_00885 [Betaproteobacteria bacterium]|nr:MAG: hypothetical protein D4R70_00885 [Betaproteobacteria bacterium]
MNKSDVAYSVYVGYADWRHAAWRGAFYPSDMPEDWRFDFYQSQYRCVWLDAAAWQAITLPEWASLAAEATTAFRFVLETTPDGVPPAVSALLGVRVVTMTRAASALLCLDSEADLKALAQRMGSASLSAPIFVIVPPTAPATMEKVETLLEILGV